MCMMVGNMTFLMIFFAVFDPSTTTFNTIDKLQFLLFIWHLSWLTSLQTT